MISRYQFTAGGRPQHDCPYHAGFEPTLPRWLSAGWIGCIGHMPVVIPISGHIKIYYNQQVYLSKKQEVVIVRGYT